jgi:hypothetical protein
MSDIENHFQFRVNVRRPGTARDPIVAARPARAERAFGTPISRSPRASGGEIAQAAGQPQIAPPAEFASPRFQSWFNSTGGIGLV